MCSYKVTGGFFRFVIFSISMQKCKQKTVKIILTYLSPPNIFWFYIFSQDSKVFLY